MFPLARYFVFVGGALMALLVAFDLFAPKAAADIGVQSSGNVDKSIVRIKSEQKWPERIVFDTTQPTVAPKPVVPKPVVQAAQAPAAPEAAPEFTAGARVRETFAQFVPAEAKKADATSAKKRKVAKSGIGQPHQPLRFAQQPGSFGTSTW